MRISTSQKEVEAGISLGFSKLLGVPSTSIQGSRNEGDAIPPFLCVV